MRNSIGRISLTLLSPLMLFQSEAQAISPTKSRVDFEQAPSQVSPYESLVCLNVRDRLENEKCVFGLGGINESHEIAVYKVTDPLRTGVQTLAELVDLRTNKAFAVLTTEYLYRGGFETDDVYIPAEPVLSASFIDVNGTVMAQLFTLNKHQGPHAEHRFDLCGRQRSLDYNVGTKQGVQYSLSSRDYYDQYEVDKISFTARHLVITNHYAKSEVAEDFPTNIRDAFFATAVYSNGSAGRTLLVKLEGGDLQPYEYSGERLVRLKVLNDGRIDSDPCDR